MSLYVSSSKTLRFCIVHTRYFPVIKLTLDLVFLSYRSLVVRQQFYRVIVALTHIIYGFVFLMCTFCGQGGQEERAGEEIQPDDGAKKQMRQITTVQQWRCLPVQATTVTI